MRKGSVDIQQTGSKSFLVPGATWYGIYGVLHKGHSTLDLQDLPNNVRLQMLNWPYHEHVSMRKY